MSYIDLQEVKIEDASGNLINPAQDETVVLLRRLVQIAATLSTQDSAQRQRITLDAAPATVTVTGTVTANPASGTITTVSTVSNLALIANVDPRYQMVDWARTAYNTGIRANLINS